MGFIFGLLVIGIVFVVIAGMWKIFEKAGQPGWAAIVPIYNIVILLEIVRKPWWWLLLMIIPYVGMIWSIWTYNLLSKSFGKDEGYTVGMIFLPFIFIPMLGFGEAQYIHNRIEAPQDNDILDSDLV
ncbi:MAG: signal peptidase I [Saprospiraceae bacterium]|nr:signal peptidase I [Saprospiraceae bacterium]MCB9322527.1 hypothetical protein [Lewinellaceae bacterium]